MSVPKMRVARHLAVVQAPISQEIESEPKSTGLGKQIEAWKELDQVADSIARSVYEIGSKRG